MDWSLWYVSQSVSVYTITIAVLPQFFSHGMAYYRSERTKGMLVKHKYLTPRLLSVMCNT